MDCVCTAVDIDGVHIHSVLFIFSLYAIHEIAYVVKIEPERIVFFVYLYGSVLVFALDFKILAYFRTDKSAGRRIVNFLVSVHRHIVGFALIGHNYGSIGIASDCRNRTFSESLFRRIVVGNSRRVVLFARERSCILVKIACGNAVLF